MSDKQKEIAELNLLLDRGESFVIAGKTLSIQKMVLRRILAMSRVAIEMDTDETVLQDDGVEDISKELFNTVTRNAKRCSDFIAIALEPDYTNAEKLSVMSDFIMDNFTAEQLKEVAQAAMNYADLQNFMTSTFLMNGKRPTQATKVED